MNAVTTAASVPELKTTAPRQDKVKGNTGEFAEMLSGAINSKQAGENKEPVKAKESDAKPKAAGKEQKTAETEKTTKPAAKAETKETPEIDEESAAVAAQASVKPQPEHQAAEENTDAAAEEVLTMMPAQAQAARIQKVYAQAGEAAPQTAETAQTTEPVKTVAQTDAAVQQAVHENQNAPATVTSAAEASGAVVQPKETKAANNVSKSQPEAQQGVAEAGTETTTTVKVEVKQQADTETAEAKTQSEGAETVSQAAPKASQSAETTEPPTKFDEMLAKASQELAQGKTAATGEEEQTVTADDGSGETVPVKAQDTRQQAAGETDNANKEAKPEKSAEAPRTEQRPLKEMPKTDELTLGLIQPKAETPAMEITRPVQQAPAANPVKIPDQAEQIRTEVIRSMENGKMEFNMQLRPQELGKVDVKMVLESGKLAVEIVAANSKSTELLSRQVEALVASLKANNIDVSSVNVVTASQNANGSMDGAYNLNNFQNQSSDGRQNGRASGQNGQNGADGADTDAQQDPEQNRNPQSILNYSI